MVDVQRTTRRSVIAAAAGALLATVARAVGRPEPVLGAGDDGQIIHVADTYAHAVGQTTLANDQNGGRVLWVASNTSGAVGSGFGVAITGYSAKNIGVEGWASIGTGVYGHSDGASVFEDGVRGNAAYGRGVWGHGNNNYGVYGTSGFTTGVVGLGSADGASGVVGASTGGGAGVVGTSGGGFNPGTTIPKTGVFGQAYQAEGRGVHGSADEGHGVHGDAGAGSGVFGQAFFPDGYAFRGSGRVRFDKVSGLATIKAGTKSKTLTPGVAVTSDSFVLLTPRSNIGGRSLWFTTDPAADTITIHVSTSRSADTKVSWLLLH